jgi:hypothetical protein
VVSLLLLVLASLLYQRFLSEVPSLPSLPSMGSP